jgi:hypothetical protein
LDTAQPAASGNHLRPQFTGGLLSVTMALIAALACAHFEPAPQPPSHVMLSTFWFIDLEASSRIRMLERTIPAGLSNVAQTEPVVPPVAAAPVPPAPALLGGPPPRPAAP